MKVARIMRSQCPGESEIVETERVAAASATARKSGDAERLAGAGPAIRLPSELRPELMHRAPGRERTGGPPSERADSVDASIGTWPA